MIVSGSHTTFHDDKTNDGEWPPYILLKISKRLDRKHEKVEEFARCKFEKFADGYIRSLPFPSLCFIFSVYAF